MPHSPLIVGTIHQNFYQVSKQILISLAKKTKARMPQFFIILNANFCALLLNLTGVNMV